MSKSGAELILDERHRQIEKEGYTSIHDDGHYRGELATAASCYAILGGCQSMYRVKNAEDMEPPRQWPWDDEWWKPSADPIRNLVKAGALIAAEIDRLQRKANARSGPLVTSSE